MPCQKIFERTPLSQLPTFETVLHAAGFLQDICLVRFGRGKDQTWHIFEFFDRNVGSIFEREHLANLVPIVVLLRLLATVPNE